MGSPSVCSHQATGGELYSGIAQSCARLTGQTSGLPQILSYLFTMTSSTSLFGEKAIPIRDQQGVLRHVLGSAGSLGLCRHTTHGVEPLWATGFLCDRTH